MRERVKAAALSVASKPGQLDANLHELEQAVGRAAIAGAELILFPELSLTGFLPNHPLADHESWLRRALLEARWAALPLDAPVIGQLVRCAARHQVWFSVGLLEDAGNMLFNTQVLLGPHGLAGHWRKLHVPMFEMPFYNGGDAPRVVDTPLGRIGANICFDVLLPESTRLLAAQNVEIVLMPFAADPPPGTPRAWSHWAAPAIQARAIENGVFAVASNYRGHVACAGVEQTFPGGGLIVSPRGEPLVDCPEHVDDTTMITADLEASRLAAARAEPEYLYRFRRPELYGPLAARPGESG